MKSVTWKFISEKYIAAYDYIVEEVNSHFGKGFLFVLLWLFILGIVTGLAFLTIYVWQITAILACIILIIEMLCSIGRGLEKKKKT